MLESEVLLEVWREDMKQAATMTGNSGYGIHSAF